MVKMDHLMEEKIIKIAKWAKSQQQKYFKSKKVKAFGNMA